MCSFELMIGLPGFWSFSDFSLSLCPGWAQFTYPDAVIYVYPGDNSLLALHNHKLEQHMTILKRLERSAQKTERAARKGVNRADIPTKTRRHNRQFSIGNYFRFSTLKS